jgi:AbrB family looped-hinge helix DNA binding protein
MKRVVPVRASSLVSVKGQTVVPKEIREALGIKEGTKLVWTMRDGRLAVFPVPEDPLRASLGILKDSGYTFDDFMQDRTEERAAERALEEREG